MFTSIVLAKFLGVIFFVMGLYYVMHHGSVSGLFDSMFKNKVSVFMMGFMLLFLGSFIVSVHNVWSDGWPVLVTLMGWWMVFKSVMLFFVPDFAHSFQKKCLEKYGKFYSAFGGLFTLFLGLIFLYFGFLV